MDKIQIFTVVSKTRIGINLPKGTPVLGFPFIFEGRSIPQFLHSVYISACTFFMCFGVLYKQMHQVTQQDSCLHPSLLLGSGTDLSKPQNLGGSGADLLRGMCVHWCIDFCMEKQSVNVYTIYYGLLWNIYSGVRSLMFCWQKFQMHM